MIRNHDRVGTSLHGHGSVFRRENAFQNYRHIRPALQPLDRLPRHPWSMRQEGGGASRTARGGILALFGHARLHISIIESVPVVAVAIRLVRVIYSEYDALAAAILNAARVPLSRFFIWQPDRIRPPQQRLPIGQNFLYAGAGTDQRLRVERRLRHHFIGSRKHQILAAGRRNDHRRIEFHPQQFDTCRHFRHIHHESRHKKNAFICGSIGS